MKVVGRKEWKDRRRYKEMQGEKEGKNLKE